MATLSGLDRYRSISLIGAGGMATVHLAEDEVLGRKVALKRLPDAGLSELARSSARSRDDRGGARLQREALLGASVNHPNLVSVYDVVTTESDELVIVMEYVPGETVAQRLDREGRLAPEAALPILEGVGAALDAIHARGIVHRDVKPANVLLGEDGTAKLADLGVATVSDRTRITSAGVVVGTFRYMAPEQLEDRPAAPSADIYSLAVMAFEMLSGERARPESHPLALAHAIATQPPPDLREAWAAAPPAAAEVLMQAMARDPAERLRSAGAMVSRLRSALQPAPARGAPAPAPPAVAPPAPTARVARPAPVVPARQPRGRETPARPRPRRQPAPAAAGPTPRRRPAAVLPAAAALLAAVAVVLLVVLSGGSSSRTHAVAGRPAATKPTRSATRSPAPAGQAGVTTAAGGATTAAAAASAPSGSGPAGAPVAAVETFYHLAAAHSTSQAWALADPTFRSQLGGYESFRAGQAGDRSITFDSARVVSSDASSATVAVTTTSVRDNGTQHCNGTVDLSRGSAGWLLHLIHISCA